MKRLQCAKCPWKVTTNPHEIPDDYGVEKHKALKSTIAEGLSSLLGPNRMMACHETGYDGEDPLPCVGYLHNQLGEGNNLGLRLAVIQGRVDGRYELDGEQHPDLEATLP